MRRLSGYECRQCGSSDLMDSSDFSTTAAKGLCNNCGHEGEVDRKARR